MRTRAMRRKALLACRSPPRWRRCRSVRPDDTGIRGSTAQAGERRLRPEPVTVVPGNGQQLPGRLNPDPAQRQQAGRDSGHQRGQLSIEVVDLGLQRLPAAGQGPQCGLDRRSRIGNLAGAQRSAGADPLLGK